MSKEVHYEGWLIKSPPSKRIWRSRWRRRWFTLKQGEIPEQFCLEYYTDRNCRKLKGIIDLDQCEQVDCGLRLENRKQKFQFMFDIKTPKRTFYLAADSEEDMRDWVNCICQVCHLHDTKHSLDDNGSIHFSNNKNTPVLAAVDDLQFLTNKRNKELNNDKLSVIVPSTSTAAIHCNSVYQNSDSTYVNAEHSNSELRDDLSQVQHHTENTTKNASIERSLTVAASGNDEKTYLNAPILSNTKEDSADRLQANGNGVIRKVPENLILQNSPLLEAFTLTVQPSPSLSTSSGPYIPISECFSGIPKYHENPTTPLNNLDPKFYDTPRSHNNIGLNLTNDKSYSPKITNCSGEQISAAKRCPTVNNRSDSDSESVFTDDDDWTYPMPLRENVDRNTRPSDSSVENESFVLTYSQRFSKLPDDVNDKTNEFNYNVNSEGKNQPCEAVKVYKNKRNLSLDIKKNESTSTEIPQLSDTENTSPAIGPQDASSIVEDSYDIPRSHQLPYHNIAEMFKEKIWDPKTKHSSKFVTSLDPSADSRSDSQEILRKHFYTNAAPNNKFEGNVFRYDFVEHSELPPVNRKLKPKISTTNKWPEEVTEKHKADKTGYNAFIEDILNLRPPSVDRNLKPNAYKLVNSTLMEHTFRCSVDIPPSIDISAETNKYILETKTLPRQNCSVAGKNKAHLSTGTIDVSILPQPSASANSSKYQTKLKLLPTNEHRLQYFDLDVANPPAANRQSTNNITKQEPSKADSLTQSPLKSGVVYNSVDFLKTEAFNRIREERKKESEGVNPK
ncbi:protein daughter of sevenless isoform X1 [Anastrepha obliqua]|uniref:protein daughter of sevenless isoform X1 n=1 Tax=Anastrepha obliqua TaxID=95512 RepID=UPI00240965B9|nr:protein daughter of sevenless isoform X1 [Anastrepha obliqua]